MLQKYFKKNSSKLLFGSFLFLLLALFIAGYPISDLYNRTFLPQPERVTELYFNTPESLPHIITAKTQTQFSFRVANHEAQPVTYSYTVTIATPGFPLQTVTSGNFTLSDSGQTDIPVPFSVTAKGVRSLITVQLIDRPEAIHFWVNS